MEIWRSTVQRRIEEATAEAAGNNLAGRGARLPAEATPFADPSNKMAHRLLAHPGFTTPWIEAGRDFQADVGMLCADLRRTAGSSAPEPVRRAQVLNRRIAGFLPQAPAAGGPTQPTDIHGQMVRGGPH